MSFEKMPSQKPIETYGDFAETKYDKWQEIYNIRKDIKLLERDSSVKQKTDFVKMKFEELSQAFSKGGLETKELKKIYYEWKKLYQENQKKIRPLKKEMDVIMDCFSKVQKLHDHLEDQPMKLDSIEESPNKTKLDSWKNELESEVLKVTQLEEKRKQITAYPSNFESAVIARNDGLKTINANIERIKTLEKTVKDTERHYVHKKVVKNLNLLKEKRKELEKLKDEWDTLSKLRELTDPITKESQVKKLEQILQEIDQISSEFQTPSDPLEKIEKAFITTFQEAPFKLPGKLSTITDLIDSQRTRNNPYEETYNKLIKQITNLHNICTSEEAKELSKYGLLKENKIDLKNNEEKLLPIIAVLYNKLNQANLTLNKLEEKIPKESKEFKEIQFIIIHLRIQIFNAILNLKDTGLTPQPPKAPKTPPKDQAY